MRSPTGCATSGRPRACRPGRLNLFRLGQRTVIIDFAHNEAGTEAILDVAAAIGGGAAGRAAPITAIIGTAGDRPDDTLLGDRADRRRRKADRIAIKETLGYLRGRERDERRRGAAREGVAEGGGDPSDGPVYPERDPGPGVGARRARGGGRRRQRAGRRAAGRRAVLPRESATKVFELLKRLGARPVDVADRAPGRCCPAARGPAPPLIEAARATRRGPLASTLARDAGLAARPGLHRCGWLP